MPDWLNGGYESPLVARIASIRDDIVKRATESHWIMDESQLTDQAIIRRMVLKRCIYGVDKNPLTVELAKVSLWLHSFTVGAPLSFLDHHLRCGDSLIGLRVAEASKYLSEWGGLFASSAIAGAESSAKLMHDIEEMSDADVAEVQASAALFSDVEAGTSDLRGLLDFVCGLRWQTAGMKSKQRKEFEAPLVETLSQDPDNTFDLLANGPNGASSSSTSAFSAMWTESKSIADRERVLHWEASFPGVWQGWQDDRPKGGFDAVIGNPPWDRIKLQEVEWFATRAPEIALATTAAARRTAIRRLRKRGRAPCRMSSTLPRRRADGLGQTVRKSSHYPLLGGGDINLYSLFVERAMSLVKPDGIVGLLTPSGIYADKTAAKFFKSVSTSGRLASLFDFENKKIFFKDVHASFKFCAITFGGRRTDRSTRHKVRVLPPRHRNHRRPRPFLSTYTGRFHQGESEYRYRAGIPYLQGCRHYAAAFTNNTLHWLIVRKAKRRRAWPVRYHTNVPYDERFQIVPYGRAT